MVLGGWVFLMREVPLYLWDPAGLPPSLEKRPPRTLNYDHAWGPMVVLGGGAVAYERGTSAQKAWPFYGSGLVLGVYG